MSILARDKVPPKTVKANINIPHCRGIPTKLPNQSHSRVVSKRLYKQKGEGRKERREDGRRNGKEKKRRRGKCPPTEQRSAASSTVQGESSAKRGKGTKKELPRVGKQAPGFVCPRIFHRVLRTRVGNESTCVSARRVKREWKPMNDIMHCFMPWIPSRYRHLLKTGHRSWPLLFFSFFRFTDWTMCTVLFDYDFILRILFEWRAKFYVYLYIATQWLKSGICNNVTRK